VNRPRPQTIDIAKLQKAFQNIYLTMDEIDSFKVKALDNLETTINSLETELDKSRSYVTRTRAAAAAEPQLDSESQTGDAAAR